MHGGDGFGTILAFGVVVQLLREAFSGFVRLRGLARKRREGGVLQLPLKAKRRGGNRMQADSFGQKGKVQEHAGSPVRRLARGVAILALAVAPHLAAADSGRVLRWTAVGRLFARGEAGGAGEGVDSADRQLGGSGNARLAREEAQGRVGDGRHVRTKDRRGKPRPTLAETCLVNGNGCDEIWYNKHMFDSSTGSIRE